MARRTKEDAEKTRESLLDAAEILFLRQGVAATTLEQIAREAGLTRGAVYWHFENKISLFNAMVVRSRISIELMYDQLFAEGNDDLVGGLKKLCLKIMDALSRDSHWRNVYTIILLRQEQLDSRDNEFARQASAKRQLALSRFTKVFAWAEKHDRLAPGVTPELAALGLHAFLSGILVDFLREPKSFKLSKHSAALVDAFFRGMLKS